MKYLTLIRTITLLHQYQRPLKEKNALQYIEVSREDIASANELAHEVLGRSLDELPPQTRCLLKLLNEKIAQVCKERAVEQEDCLFTRRQVREWSGWSHTQIKVHLDRLEELEYILPRRGMRGSAYEYELLFDGDLDCEKSQLIGLIDAKSLDYDGEFAGVTGELTPLKRPLNGGVTLSSLAAERSAEAGINGMEFKALENAQEPRILTAIVS